MNLVLELCCFEWFQNRTAINTLYTESFRAVLFRMVPKLNNKVFYQDNCFRAVLFRMVPKPHLHKYVSILCFRAVLFRMVPKLLLSQFSVDIS